MLAAIAEDVRAGRVSAEEVTIQALERAEAQVNLNLFITIAHEAALGRARELDARRLAGLELGPLAGVPVVVKDNICTAGLRTTAASASLAEFVPPYSATVVERLEQAGAVVIAKSNLDEFGMGSSNERSYFGPARNPWDPSRVPGGSSGGSAAAVAAGVVPMALGTDTGGSVRQPAGFCGVLGFKPTYGRLSRYGVIAFASSLEQVGVLAQSSQDVALAMAVMAGADPLDATALAQDASEFDALASAEPSLAGLRVGVVTELSNEGNSPGVRAALARVKTKLSELGVELGEVSLPSARYGIAAYYLVATAEASSNLARFDGMLYSARVGENALGQAAVMQRSRGASFGAEVRRRILMGTYALSAGYYDAYYGKALKVRRLIADELKEAFTRFDVLLTPTSPTPAYPLGAKLTDPLAMYLDDLNTVLANLAGLPALSLPAGLAEDGLPCGVQLLAPALKDTRLLAVARGLERAMGALTPPHC
jgi:aspartyl-tRNA(Asn)/glutamyl-tRNA(Gln) amidotransferase subunit A